MEAIKDVHISSGDAIQTVLPQTFKIFSPLILANKASIEALPLTTHSYGSHPRQILDLVHSSVAPESAPVIIFLHGGGLIRGDKTSPQIAEGLVYRNVAAFFASRGITTINPNYRRVNSQFGGEDAVFPSGGEDVELVLKWIEESGEVKGKRDVYLIGNSAGGVHATTFVLAPNFLEQRKKYVSGEGNVTLKGLIDVSVPFHFHSALGMRGEVNEKYYGDAAAVKENCVYGLLEAIKKSGKSREELAIPKTMVLLGEYDPEDEIGAGVKDFVRLWKDTWGEEGLTYVDMPGHNHISPPWCLMSGEEKGEKWGEDVVAWIKG